MRYTMIKVYLQSAAEASEATPPEIAGICQESHSRRD